MLHGPFNACTPRSWRYVRYARCSLAIGCTWYVTCVSGGKAEPVTGVGSAFLRSQERSAPSVAEAKRLDEEDKEERRAAFRAGHSSPLALAPAKRAGTVAGRVPRSHRGAQK